MLTKLYLMQRKGYDPDAQDVPVILAIHNLVNEQGWAKIKQWEALRKPEATPKLLRFTGRPKDISPKAFLRSLVGYQLPFDRHDWVVEREDGQQVRYVIDFYEGRGSDRPLPSKEGESSSSPVSIYLDVRPALDSVPSVLDRLYVSLLPSALSSPTPLPKKNNTAMMTQQTDDGAKK